jgi:hypothetical protein
MEEVERTLERGNARRDSATQRGWLVGHFVEPTSSLLHSDDVEIRWHDLVVGDARLAMQRADRRTALCLLISGALRLRFEGGREIVLAEEADYAMWRGIGHTWQVERPGIAVVIRWPSSAAPD